MEEPVRRDVGRDHRITGRNCLVRAEWIDFRAAERSGAGEDGKEVANAHGLYRCRVEKNTHPQASGCVSRPCTVAVTRSSRLCCYCQLKPNVYTRPAR